MTWGKAKEKGGAKYEARTCFMADVSEKYQSQIHRPIEHLEISVAYNVSVLDLTVETNSKIQNIRDLYRGINDFTKGYRPRCSIVNNEKGD